MTLKISDAARELIVDEEVGSQATYIKKYQHPEWPGGASGVTIGIGYDVGYQSKEEVHSDWSGTLPSVMVDKLESVTGLKAQAAKSALPLVKSDIQVPWDSAMHVFDNVDEPRWIARTSEALPNCDKLHPDCLGSLTSISYNRGASYSAAGDRYEEMRAIKALMAGEEFAKIPSQIRSMKRLWTNGLVGRREREAKLFERGLAIMSGIHTEETAPKVRTRSEEVKRSAAQTGTIAGTAGGVGTGTSPKPEVVKGHAEIYVAGAVLICIVVGVALTLYLGRHQKLPKAD